MTTLTSVLQLPIFSNTFLIGFTLISRILFVLAGVWSPGRTVEYASASGSGCTLSDILHSQPSLTSPAVRPVIIMLADFYPNVIMSRSDLCYRKSVYRLSVCRLSVTLVHPTQGVEAFGNISSPLVTVSIF